MHEFESVLDGAKGLLVETIKLLNTLNINYVIIGGWSPLLRNDTDITHPGTRDVDILFLEARSKACHKKSAEVIVPEIKSTRLGEGLNQSQLSSKWMLLYEGMNAENIEF